jgi:hypothetical protein
MNNDSNSNWNNFHQLSKFQKAQAVVGIIKHPISTLWQSWISLYQDEIIFYAAHKTQKAAKLSAEVIYQSISETWKDGLLLNSNSLAEFISTVPNRVLPEPLPKFMQESLIKVVRDFREAQKK